MKPKSLLTYMLALAATVSLAMAAVSAVDPPKIVIHVANGLKPGALPLEIDCISAGVDLGRLQLTPDVDFKWRFDNDKWDVGQFFCSFWWGSKSIINLDLYTNKCKVMAGEVWFMADEDGILVKSDDHPDWIRQCPWEFQN